MYSVSITNKTPVYYETWADVLELLKHHDCNVNNTLIFKNEYLFASFCYPDCIFYLHNLHIVNDEFPEHTDQINNLKSGIMDISKNNIHSLVTNDYKYYCVDNYPDEGIKQEEVLKILSLCFFIDINTGYPLIFMYNFD